MKAIVLAAVALGGIGVVWASARTMAWALTHRRRPDYEIRPRQLVEGPDAGKMVVEIIHCWDPLYEKGTDRIRVGRPFPVGDEAALSEHTMDARRQIKDMKSVR